MVDYERTRARLNQRSGPPSEFGVLYTVSGGVGHSAAWRTGLWPAWLRCCSRHAMWAKGPVLWRGRSQRIASSAGTNSVAHWAVGRVASGLAAVLCTQLRGWGPCVAPGGLAGGVSAAALGLAVLRTAEAGAVHQLLGKVVRGLVWSSGGRQPPCTKALSSGLMLASGPRWPGGWHQPGCFGAWVNRKAALASSAPKATIG